MKKVLAIAVFLVALMSWAQVKLFPFTRGGTLAWTNWVGPGMADVLPDDAPGYHVESATSVDGPWSFVTNTTSNFVSVGPPSTATAGQYYRIAWTNGQMWSYKGYQGESLIVTGSLYLNISAFGLVDGGSWYFTRIGGSALQWHRVGSNTLDSCLDCSGQVFFAPYCCDNDFWLDGPQPTSMVWTGSWHYRGFADQTNGQFVAERIAR